MAPSFIHSPQPWHWLHRGASSGCTTHACVLCCAQLMVVCLARCEQLPSVSRGMLRQVLRSGVHLSLELRAVSASMLAFWGAALAEAADLHLSLDMRGLNMSSADEQRVQQLAAAAPGGEIPGITQLTLKVHSSACCMCANYAAMFASSTDC